MPAGLQPWYDWFDRATLTRAAAYADDGSVERVQRDGEEIIATVQGHRSYQVRLHLQGLLLDDERGILGLDLDSSCTCPVAWGCKHAAAALIALARKYGLPDGLGDDGEPAEATSVPQPPRQPPVAVPDRKSVV